MLKTMAIAESELIINSDGSAFHIHIRPEELSDNIILVGDPGRTELIGDFLTDVECRHSSREFVSLAGYYNGKRITVLSTGIGTDNIDIVMTELDALANVDFATREIKENKKSLNILRLGTSGAVRSDIPLGSYVFSEISIGCDGLMNWYSGRDSIVLEDYEKAFKSHVGWSGHLPDPYFVRAGKKMADKFRGRAIMGMTISAPGFYGPQGRVIRLPLAIDNMIEKFESFSYDGHVITNIEMEASAIAGLSAKLGHNAGTMCCIIANRAIGNSNPDYKSRISDMVGMALDTLSEK